MRFLKGGLFTYETCRLCPRDCGANRATGQIGRCGMTDEIKIARIAPHMWEEPILSGTKGSGAVFFSGCPLQCLYCQNRAISFEGKGEIYSADMLCDAFLSLQAQGCHNINLVTATHFAPTVKDTVAKAKENGLSVPAVWNTSGYESEKTLALLEGVVDIYLTDLRYAKAETARAYSAAPDYPEIAKNALAKMVRQVGKATLGEDGLLKKGVVVRFLLLPEHLLEAKLLLKNAYDTYGEDIYYSLMSQYTPSPSLPSPLNRTVNEREYRSFVAYAEHLCIQNAFVQELGSASESFIPAF